MAKVSGNISYQQPSGVVAIKTNDRNTLIQTLIDGGILTKLDVVYILTPFNEQASVLNLINPLDNILVKNLSISFDNTKGFTGNSADSSYMAMDFNPSVDGINFTNASASIGVFMTSTVSEDHAFLIGYSAGGTLAEPAIGIINRYGRWQGKVNEGTAGNTEVCTCGKNDMFAVAVRDAGDSLLYVNGRLVDTKTIVTGTNLCNHQLQVLRNGLGANNPSDNSFGCIFLGAKLTAAEILIFYNAVHAYFAAVGVSVPDKNILAYINFEGSTYSENGYWTGTGVNFNPNYTTTVLSGTQSLYIPDGERGNFKYLKSGTNTTEISFMIRFDALPSSNFDMIFVKDVVTTVASCKLYSTGRVYMSSGGKTLYDTTVLSVDTVYYIWLEYVKGTGADSEFHLYINTSDTKPGAPSGSITGGDETLQSDTFDIYNINGQSVNFIFDEILVKEI